MRQVDEIFMARAIQKKFIKTKKALALATKRLIAAEVLMLKHTSGYEKFNEANLQALNLLMVDVEQQIAHWDDVLAEAGYYEE